MSTMTMNVNIIEVIGHYVEAEISLKGYYGKSVNTLTGRIIYSDYNASLFFKPKGSRNKGYIIDSVDSIHSVKIIRKDKASNEYYMNAYNNKEKAEVKLNDRLEKERILREQERQMRIEKMEEKRRMEQERAAKEIETAQSLGGYEELEAEVIAFYQSFKEDFFNENFVKATYIPILNKLIHKGIENINEYPKHYFDKKHNPKFCKLIEDKLNIKLTNTQKGNVDKLNKYLAS